MARASKKLHKPKSIKSIRKTLSRIKKNNEVLRKLKN